MASVGVAPSGYKSSSGTIMGVEKLPDQMNTLKIRDDKEVEATIINSAKKITQKGCFSMHLQVVSYMAELIVGQGSFGIVFQAGEVVALKKVLRDKPYKNRELLTMRHLEHPNVVALKLCFFSTTDKDKPCLNLLLDYIPESAHRVVKHYNKMNQQSSTCHLSM